MSDLSEYIEAHIPDGWKLCNLIQMDETYQANICDGDHIAIGTGETMEEALLAAGTKAENGVIVGRLAHVAVQRRLLNKEEDKLGGPSLLISLGLSKPKPKIARRL